jgi:hypothetical protein
MLHKMLLALVMLLALSVQMADTLSAPTKLMASANFSALICTAKQCAA